MFANSSQFLGISALSSAILLSAGFCGIIGDQKTDDKKNSAEHAAVKRACLDYVEGIYEVKPEWIKRSVHPDLKKFGFARTKDGYRGIPMTFDQLVTLAGKWNKDGRAGNDSPKKVEIFDVLDKTASAKLTAHWGIDYFHLVKEDDKWLIYQVLWQSPPAELPAQ